MRLGYFSLSACSSISRSKRLQFSYDLLDSSGPELSCQSRFADINSFNHQIQYTPLFLRVQQFPDWIQRFQVKGTVAKTAGFVL
jgi:hypothetical protein